VHEDRLDERVLEDIKVRACFVAPFDRAVKLLDMKSDEKISSGSVAMDGCPKSVRYPVDGGHILTIPGVVRENACEILFERYGHESNIATLILEVLRLCPRDMRKCLAENVVLIGGTTLLPGFRHRLHQELIALIKNDNLYSSNLHFESFKFHKNTMQRELCGMAWWCYIGRIRRN